MTTPPQTSGRLRLLRLWYFVSLTLAVAMPIKELALPNSRESFHWSYDSILSLAALSLFAASACIFRRERLFAVGGFLCGIVALLYAGRPTF